MADRIGQIKSNVGKMIDGGATEPEIDAYLAHEGVTAEQLRAPSAPAEQPSFGQRAMKTADDIMRSLASGATFGFADEIAGGMNTLTGLGGDKTLSENIKAEQARDKEIPAAISIPGNIAGGVASGIATAAPVLGAKALASVPNIVKSVGVGAAQGGLAGAGYAEEGERLAGAGKGAAIGGALGAVVPALTATARAVGRTIAKPFQSPATKALEKIGEAVSRDDVAAERLASRMGAMGEQATLADAGGRNVQGLAAAAVRQPGGAGNRAQIVLNQRQLGQASRLTDAAKRIVGQGDDFSTVVDDVIATRAKDAAPLYEKAYEKTIDLTDDLVNIVKRPAFRQAFQNARTIALNEGDDIPALIVKNAKGENVINAEALKETRVWDYIKRGLDDVIEGAKEPITGKIKTDQGRALVGLKQKMLEELDNINPDFKAARASFAGHSESLDALQQGRSFLKGDVDLTRKQIEALADADKEFFRIGVIQGIKDKVETASDTANAVRKIFGNQKLREKMAAVFPDQKAFREFERTMISETRFANTRAKVLSGSQTAERLEESADLAGTALDAATGNKLGLARRAVQAVTNRAPSPDISREIGQLLFNTNQGKNAATIEELNRMMLARELAKGRAQGVNAGLVGGGLTAIPQTSGRK